MTEYANGADGCCQICGESTEEEWHAFCSSCYAEEQGWGPSRHRPDPDALRQQHEDRAQVVTTRLLERLDEIEIRVARLEHDRRAT